ncbi:MAG: peptide chain release factor 2 [Candidatus Omnitrophica bacterium]|nr:peptide chain release factor 2 [Candidatus Omnitrophota bacterium]MDD5517950.1 peptide chain release factor 2 [Candidatus Omnitrophota bacterium]
MLDELKSKLGSIQLNLEQLRGYFDIDNKKKLIADLSTQMSEPGFWDDSEKSTRIVRQLKTLKNTVEPWEVSAKKHQELQELADILNAQDSALYSELNKNIDSLLSEVGRLEFKTLLSGEFDPNNAILSINSGAGGTESCDWVEMLFRMYTRFAEQRGWKVKALDILYGEEAGIKNVTVLVEGEYAYGYLKEERGVHRLVRISPFDANKRRHTSFASVDIIPEVQEDIDLKLEEKDLRIDVYRSKGAGGQSVNTTDSAVRITHIPTGLVAQCQNERSQHQNKQTALKILKARIYELEKVRKEEEMLKAYAGGKKKIEFGSQIRSYVMHPYNMVKDHRTDYETGDVAKVMDGGLDEFIEAHLKLQKKAQ